MILLLSLDSIIRPAEGIKIRAEDFGGILYDHQTGKIIFLKSGILYEIIANPGKKTIETIFSRYGLTPKEVQKIVSLLERLCEEGWIVAT